MMKQTALRNNRMMLQHMFTKLGDTVGGSYSPFLQELRKMFHPMRFKCDWNGYHGNAAFVENYFAALISAFNVEPAMCWLADNRAENIPGELLLKHYRPFCEWWPTDQTIRVPCTVSLQNQGQHVTQFVFAGSLQGPFVQAGCPQHVASVTGDPRAMNHLGELVRQGRAAIRASEVLEYSSIVAHGLDPQDPACFEKLASLRRRKP